ncbi:MAG TPA: tetratricopeptide repeat protein [Rhodothermales bacterium]|nr:tetratricopeptide repeat protein [Rhodothermales bacterium]
MAKNISGLAMVLMNLKQFDEAEKLYREALQIRLEILASNHPGRRDESQQSGSGTS